MYNPCGGRLRGFDPEYSPEPDAPPTVLTTAPEWKGLRKGLRAVMEVQTRQQSMVASVRMCPAILVKVGSKLSAGDR